MARINVNPDIDPNAGNPIAGGGLAGANNIQPALPGPGETSPTGVQNMPKMDELASLLSDPNTTKRQTADRARTSEAVRSKMAPPPAPPAPVSKVVDNVLGNNVSPAQAKVLHAAGEARRKDAVKAYGEIKAEEQAQKDKKKKKREKAKNALEAEKGQKRTKSEQFRSQEKAAEKKKRTPRQWEKNKAKAREEREFSPSLRWRSSADRFVDPHGNIMDSQAFDNIATPLSPGSAETSIVPVGRIAPDIVPVSNQRSLGADPNRPNTVIGPSGTVTRLSDGRDRNLLPGYTDTMNYGGAYVAKGETEDEAIRRTINAQAEAHEEEWARAHPNAVDLDVEYSDRYDYQEDYESGNRDRTRYDDSFGQAERRMRESAAKILSWLKKCFVPSEGMYIDENGVIRESVEVEHAINRYMARLGLAPEERWLVYYQLAKRLGLSPDRNGLFFHDVEEGVDTFRVPDDVIQRALADMLVSCSDPDYQHPYGFTDTSFAWAGSRRYPIGVMDYEEARILCQSGHIFEGQNPHDVISRAANTWVNETYPDILKNVYREENGMAQLTVLEDFVRAVCSMDGISPRLYHVSDVADRGYQELISETRPGAFPNETEADRETQEFRAEQLRRQRRNIDRTKREALDKLDRRRNRRKGFYKTDILDDNGNVIHRRGDRVRPWDDANEADIVYTINPEANGIDSFCTFVANAAKLAGVAGYVPIMGSAIVENAQGSINAKVANRILFAGAEEYMPTDRMYAQITTEAGVEAIAAWKSLLYIGGQDAVKAFNLEYSVLNKENAREFINKHVKRETKDGFDIKPIRFAMDRVDEVLGWLMPGDKGFGKIHARRWLEGFMINNRYNSMDPQGVEYSFTSPEVAEMLDTMGAERFLASVTEMNAGREAMVMVKNQTLDRTNPLTHKVDQILRSNGVTNMVVTLGIDTYFTYGLNLVQMMIPFSNTFSYLSVRGINMLMTGGRNDTTRDNIDSLNYQLGGNDEFWTGLHKNLVYDIVKLGNICLISGFLFFVIQALGFDEPEDENLKYVWNEYRVGRNFNLGGFDENGNPTGIPVYAAWWLNDLTMFALPMAYALNSTQLDQKLKDKDPELPTKLFFSGCYDMLSGCSLLDLIKTVNRVNEDFHTYETMMETQDMDCPPDWFSYTLMQCELFLARGLGKLVPNAYKAFKTDTFFIGESAFDHTPYSVYDRDSNTPGKTVPVDDWFELQRRIESKYNPLYALYNNWTKNGYLFDDGTTDKTGYRLEEMPISTMKDKLRLWWCSKYDYDPDSIPLEDRISYTESKIEEVIEDIYSFGSVEEALSKGFMIPAQLRFKMRDYCYQHINFEENLYNQGYQNYSTMKINQNKYYDILNNWVFNKDIPWTDEGYAKLVTSLEVVFFYKDNGVPATMFDYWTEGDGVIEKKYLPRGDHPNSFALFTTPDRRNRGYNYETKAAWYKEGTTDVDAIYQMLDEADAVVPSGKDAGVYVQNAIFGGQPGYTTTEPIKSDEYKALNNPTINYRAYEPWDVKFLDDLKNVSREDVGADSSLGEMGKYIDKSSWKTSSYPSWSNQSWPTNGQRNYSSGGGSNYSPKIYSNPRSLNAPKAATMYTKQPYNTNTSYLRPSVSTKGSREASKRQDF